MNLFVNLILGRIAKGLDGYKTTIGGMGMILLGVTGLIGHYWPDSQCPNMDTEKSLGLIAGGFTALGLGGKLEKVIQK